jgi:hypothetical protein
MSWVNTRKQFTGDEEAEAEGEGEEGEESEKKPVNQNEFGIKRREYEAFTEDQAVTRKPHPKFKHFLEIEKRVRKATSKTLKTYIIFSGIMYGEGEDFLHPWFKVQIYKRFLTI